MFWLYKCLTATRHPSSWPLHFIVGFDLEKENAMSETLREACRASLESGGKTYYYYSLTELAKTYPALEKLPYSLKVLLENLLRNEDAGSVTKADIAALANWAHNGQKGEIAFRPSRILLQDFTGVPAVVDLAAMRDAWKLLGVTRKD